MQVFNLIHLRNVKGDLFGGVTAAVIALPMALAFGVASGAGPAAGMYGAILVGLFAALFGGSRTLISEPTGPMTVVFTAVIAKLIAADQDQGMAMAFTVVILAGFFQIMFGMMRLGKYVTLMPYPVISGFMSGIGIILIILQIGPVLGHATPGGGVLGTLEAIPSLLNKIQYSEMLLAGITIAILYFLPARLKRYVPPQLVALVVVTLISIAFFTSNEIRRISDIGSIPTGLPSFQMPVFSIAQWEIIVLDALILGMLGCIDALLTSVVADNITRTQHNSDKELIGQGLGNMASGFFGGLPGAGATMGTIVSIQAGAKTALAGIVRAIILLVVVLWAAGITAIIPLAVLAAIALKVGADIIDWSFLKRAHHISFKGALIVYGVITLTVFVDLIVAVGLGLFIANIMTITRLAELQANDVKLISDPNDADVELNAREQVLLRNAQGQVLLLHLRGALNFGVSRTISQKNTVAINHHALVIDMTEVDHLGVSAAITLEEMIDEMLRAKKQVYIVGAHDQALQRLQKLKVSGGQQFHVSDNLQTALTEALKNVPDELKQDAEQPASGTV